MLVHSGNQHLIDCFIKNKLGKAEGIASICSANLTVLEASIRYAAEKDIPILIESTSNQVNQFGGYTGMMPDQFVEKVSALIKRHGLDQRNLILGGDHLGPYPWRMESAQEAMTKARKMVTDYVLAGFSKIHLDASMVCADDPLDKLENKKLFAKRAADLCRAAEDAASQLADDQPHPLYVIGTEVPTPGGAVEEEDELEITTVDGLEEMIDLSRQSFLEQGLDAAWERVVAVVVQPGVEFGDQLVHEYQPQKTKQLIQFIEQDEFLVYEAHSTDYQTRRSLQNMVADHFAILKVGPELTFAYRQALFSLELIEQELAPFMKSREVSNLCQTVDDAMLADSSNWGNYYTGLASEKAFARKYSFSDRIRYYWSNPSVVDAIHRLIENLSVIEVPLPLISQYLPCQYERIREGSLENDPYVWIVDQIKIVLEKYHQAVSCDF